MQRINKIFIFSICLIFQIQNTFAFNQVTGFNVEGKQSEQTIKIVTGNQYYIHKITEIQNTGRILSPFNKIPAFKKQIQNPIRFKLPLLYSRENGTLSYNLPELLYNILPKQKTEIS